MVDWPKNQANDVINQPSIDVVKDQAKDQDLKPISYPSIDAVEDVVPDNNNDSAKDLTDGNDHADYQSKDISNHINNDSYQDINDSSYNERSESASVIGLPGMAGDGSGWFDWCFGKASAR